MKAKYDSFKINANALMQLESASGSSLYTAFHSRPSRSSPGVLNSNTPTPKKSSTDQFFWVLLSVFSRSLFQKSTPPCCLLPAIVVRLLHSFGGPEE